MRLEKYKKRLKSELVYRALVSGFAVLIWLYYMLIAGHIIAGLFLFYFVYVFIEANFKLMLSKYSRLRSIQKRFKEAK